MEKNNPLQTGNTLIAGKEINESIMNELRRANERVEAASMGGSSDWDGGGNPHRMMEEMDREYAWRNFCDLCKSHGLDPYAVREALRRN